MDAKELKSIIRASLISNPLKTTVRALQNEFRNNEGIEFPYKDLGHRSFVEYLYSIPDTVQVIGNGPHAEVRVVLDGKSAHIAALVSKQKSTKKKRPCGRFQPQFCQERAKFIQPLFPTNVHKRETDLPQQNICSKIPANDSNVNIDANCRDVKNEIFNTCDNINNTVANCNSVRNEILVTTNVQETLKINEILKVDQKKILTCESFEKSIGAKSCEDLESELQTQFYSSDIKVENKLNDTEFYSSDDDLTENHDYLHSNDDRNNFHSGENDLTEHNNNFYSNGTDKSTDTFYSAQTNQSHRNQNLPSMKEHPERYSSDSSDCGEVRQVPVWTRSFKNSNRKLMQPAESVVINECVSNRRKMLAKQSMVVNYKVPLVLQSKLNELIQKFPEGLMCSKLNTEYNKLSGKHFKYTDYGYKSLIQMCCDLPSIFKFVHPDNGDYKLFHTDCEVPLVEKNFTENEKVVMDEKEDYDVNKPAIPDNLAEIFRSLLELPEVVQLNESIPVQKVLSSIDEYIDVQVAEVYDPSKFWFNLQTHVVKLNTLMDEMQEFYRERHQEYAVSRCGIQEGLYCVVIYMRDYHRAVVTNLMEHSDTNLKVFFIDYGTVSTVSKDGLCYLHANFAELPAQALRGRLAKIHPPSKNDMWSVPSSKYFLKMVRNKECIAQIIARDENTKIFELVIADTSGEEDIFINDCLVLAGYARFEYQGWIDVFNYGKHVPLVENIHLYPTFEEIESAKVPSITELLIISGANIPLDRVFPQYFGIKNSEDEIQQSPSGKCTFFRLDDVKIKTPAFDDVITQVVKQENYENEEEEEFEYYGTPDCSPESLEGSSFGDFASLNLTNGFQSPPLSFIVRKPGFSPQAETPKPPLRRPPGFHSPPNQTPISPNVSWNGQNLEREDRLFNLTSNTQSLRSLISNTQNYGSSNQRIDMPYSDTTSNLSSQMFNNVTSYQQSQRCDSQLYDLSSNVQNSRLFNTQASNQQNLRSESRLSNITSNTLNLRLDSPMFSNPTMSLRSDTPLSNSQSLRSDTPLSNMRSETPLSNPQSLRNDTPLSNRSSNSQSVYAGSPTTPGVVFSPPPFPPSFYPHHQQHFVNYNYSPVRIVPAYGYQQMQPPQQMFYNYPQPQMVYTNQQMPLAFAQNKRPSGLNANAPVYVHNQENVAKVNARVSAKNNKESKEEAVVVEEVTNPTSRRRFAVKAELFGLILHVILYNEEPHLLISEIHAHYPGKSLLMLKRALCMERSIGIVDVNLKINTELRDELIKNKAVNGNKDIMDVIPLRHIADVVKCLGQETILIECLEPVLRQYNRDSQVWYESV